MVKGKTLFLLVFIGLFLLSLFLTADAAQKADALKPYIESVEQAKEGLTLWQMIQSGGFIMVFLGLLSVGTTALVIYNFLTLRVDNLSPKEFSEELIQKLEEKKAMAARSMCQTERNIISSIALSGLSKKNKGAASAREAMENCLGKEIGTLWKHIGYLSDIAVIAPLIGLLGTVLGMIQAFNVIAFQTAVVKPIVLAGGVSKAMVTTAGGLIVAIPAMFFFSYFRAKVQDIENIVESYSTDIIKLVEES